MLRAPSAPAAPDFHRSAGGCPGDGFAQQMLQSLDRGPLLTGNVAGCAVAHGQPDRAVGGPHPRPSLSHQPAGHDPFTATRQPVRHHGRHGLGDRQRVLRRPQQLAAAFADMSRIFLVPGVSQRPVELPQHHFGKADHGIEGRAQLMAHLGQKLVYAGRGRCVVGGLESLLLSAASQREERGCRAGRHQKRQMQRRQAPDRGQPRDARIVPAHGHDQCQTEEVQRRRPSGQPLPIDPEVDRMCRPMPAPRCSIASAPGWNRVPPWGDVPSVIPRPSTGFSEKAAQNRIQRRNTPANHYVTLTDSPRCCREAKSVCGKNMATVSAALLEHL